MSTEKQGQIEVEVEEKSQNYEEERRMHVGEDLQVNCYYLSLMR